MAIFIEDQTLLVVTDGPGKLTLLSYGSNDGIRNHVDAKTTSKTGETRWVIGLSHTFTSFAFYWDGPGQAYARIGNSFELTPVGKSWKAASQVNWGATSFLTADVTAEATSAVTSAVMREVAAEQAKSLITYLADSSLFTSPTAPSPSLSAPIRCRPVPGPLDLSTTAHRPGARISQPFPSALSTAMRLNSLEEVVYPEYILSPRPELNQGAREGKFK
jgi:hypothetical protein